MAELDEDVIMHTSARGVVARLARRCIDDTAETDSDIPDLIAALKARFLSADPAKAPGWGERLAANSPGDEPLRVPLLVAQGLADTLVRPEVTQRYIDRQCGAGAAVELHTYAGVGHFAVRTVAAPVVIDWLTARLDGPPSAGGCTTTEHPSASAPHQ